MSFIIRCMAIALIVGGLYSARASRLIDFEPLTPAAGTYWNGLDGSGGFTLADIHFGNRYTDFGWGFYSWGGFALSAVEDTTTSGHENQYAVYTPGKAFNHGSVYAVVYDDGLVALDFPYPARVRGFSINNTTYTALSIQHGSAFSAPFSTNDWFKLTVTGYDHLDAPTGALEYYLADYRAADTNDWHLQAGWGWFDLTGLGPRVRRLEFALSSSDIGSWGMNTPAYFAMDRLEILPSPLFFEAEGLGSERVFSGGLGGDNLFDPAVPGFVGPAGDGIATNAAPEQYRNAAFGAWAAFVETYAPVPGITEPFDNPANALGPVSANHFDGVVSLGDLDETQIAANIPPGSITLGFDVTVIDGPGPDFVVFENGSGDASSLFAELAYVEVSTDGETFARFPSLSLTPSPVGPWSHLNPTQVYNLPGKHANNQYAANPSWGTPFDLAELTDHPAVLAGTVDLQDIRYVRLVDIPGTGDFLDALGNPIYDPWYTANSEFTGSFGNSGGFDLEAVGVLNAAHFYKIDLRITGAGSIHPYGVPHQSVSIQQGGALTFSIEPDPGVYLADVRVDGVSLGPVETVEFIDVSDHHRLEADFGNYLTVTSAHGSGSPAIGQHLIPHGQLTLTMPESPVLDGSTQYVCIGWAGTGNVPAEGSGDAVSIAFEQNSSIAWRWQTNYWVSIRVDGEGSVNADSGWKAAGVGLNLAATPDPWFSFTGWSGDTQDNDPAHASLTLLPAEPLEVTAAFGGDLVSRRVPVAWLDHHGLLADGTDPEIAAETVNPQNQLAAWEAFYAGCAPTDADARFTFIGLERDTGSGKDVLTWLGGTKGSMRPFSILSAPAATGVWEAIESSVPRSATGTNTWSLLPPETGTRFYRIRVSVPES